MNGEVGDIPPAGEHHLLAVLLAFHLVRAVLRVTHHRHVGLSTGLELQRDQASRVAVSAFHLVAARGCDETDERDGWRLPPPSGQISPSLVASARLQVIPTVLAGPP